jgi:hypothetical protein
MQRGGYQLWVTDSSRDTGGCQFAGMGHQLPRACEGGKESLADWQLFLHQVQIWECT